MQPIIFPVSNGTDRGIPDERRKGPRWRTVGRERGISGDGLEETRFAYSSRIQGEGGGEGEGLVIECSHGRTNPVQPFPIVFDGSPPLRRDPHGGLGNFFADEMLVDGDQIGLFQFGKVAGKVSLGQSGHFLKEQEFGHGAGGECVEDGQPGGFVNQLVQSGQFLEGCHGSVTSGG